MSTNKKLISWSTGLLICLAVLLLAMCLPAAAAEMTVPGAVGNCAKCHNYAEHAVDQCSLCHDAAKFEPTATLPGGHGGLKMPEGKKTLATAPVGNCQECHKYAETYINLCQNCHPSYWSRYGYTGGALVPDATLRWDANYTHDSTRINNYVGMDTTYNCESCHIQNNWTSIPQAPHEAGTFGSDSVHLSTLTTDCAQCHDAYLTKEHAATIRNYSITPSAIMDCYTCHGSSDPAVKVAITSNNKNCSACHQVIGTHEEKHISNMGSGCMSAACHDTDLTKDHLKRNLSCASCHESTSGKVQKAVAGRNKGCGSCHETAHQANVLPDISTDVLYYPGLKWGVPVPLAAMNGESWVEGDPTGYSIIISNRAAISAADVWSFYNNGLTGRGWTLASEAPAAGSTSFKASFTKDSETMIIWCYGSEDHSGSGTVSTGSRVEIIFN